jgi:hypothetical protein
MDDEGDDRRQRGGGPGGLGREPLADRVAEQLADESGIRIGLVLDHEGDPCRVSAEPGDEDQIGLSGGECGVDAGGGLRLERVPVHRSRDPSQQREP